MQLRQLLLQYEIENNIKHDEAAKRIGIGRATYFRWLKGESTHLKANTLKKLSDMLDCFFNVLAFKCVLSPFKGQYIKETIQHIGL